VILGTGLISLSHLLYSAFSLNILVLASKSSFFIFFPRLSSFFKPLALSLRRHFAASSLPSKPSKQRVIERVRLVAEINGLMESLGCKLRNDPGLAMQSPFHSYVYVADCEKGLSYVGMTEDLGDRTYNHLHQCHLAGKTMKYLFVIVFQNKYRTLEHERALKLAFASDCAIFESAENYLAALARIKQSNPLCHPVHIFPVGSDVINSLNSMISERYHPNPIKAAFFAFFLTISSAVSSNMNSLSFTSPSTILKTLPSEVAKSSLPPPPLYVAVHGSLNHYTSTFSDLQMLKDSWASSSLGRHVQFESCFTSHRSMTWLAFFILPVERATAFHTFFAGQHNKYEVERSITLYSFSAYTDYRMSHLTRSYLPLP